MSRSLQTVPFQLINGKMQLCSTCSRSGHANNQTTSGAIEYQDRTLRVESVVPHAEQNVGAAYPTGVTATVDFPTQEWTFAPQALVRTQIPCFSGLAELFLQQYQNSEYAFRHDAVDSLQIEMDMVLNNGALDLSVPERLRRLARRYINNPDSTVNGVHLESGPSGRFQVVITIGDVLGDVMN
ncbi:hypothetical protein F5888DRAFT_538767 [Russula emetica]|nr:hypothetical protein F5888DRAFT_538767 [Russula emetica]